MFSHRDPYLKTAEKFYLGGANKPGHIFPTDHSSLLDIHIPFYWRLALLRRFRDLYFLSLKENKGEEIDPKALCTLPCLVVKKVLADVFRIGNCGEQAESLFLEILLQRNFTTSLELIDLKGKSQLVEGAADGHRTVVLNRKAGSSLNLPREWGSDVEILDTWAEKRIKGKTVTNLSKEELAAFGGIVGEITVVELARRESYLTEKECDDVIEMLKNFSLYIEKNIDDLMFYVAINLEGLLKDETPQSIIESLQKQIKEEIACYEQQKKYCRGEGLVESKAEFKAEFKAGDISARRETQCIAKRQILNAFFDRIRFNS